ncbi:cyclic nucleotide-binding domain-containing protein [Aestuariirhabdus litorea]|uniref:Cyclic nucleotide-binding domain-containing protein n=1 Tax=Aestuariirhabdus litorea TaxID=2528527 RepID=A0A3P3VPN7_9GAMM|nr:cyclic nucleotide-binding domain-containing protein [Aestuariirhabdus litorea]RRJ84741.1 cyclic nucleotide-binding domain-containing protein [Aestuariirhabdus litorea]RWW97966.1 cyclic nucleotide-binding domain-containing protein [Endozoicomonadaceae bacterium GTF-13]
MDIEEEVCQLAKVPMFSKLETSKLRLIAFTSEALTYQAGETLFEKDQPADSAFVIMSGAVEVLANGAGTELVVAVRGANSLIGEMAVITKQPRSATIRARSEVEVLRIGEDIFIKLLTENPEVSLDVMRQLSHKLAEAQTAYEALQEKLRLAGG